MKAGCTIRSFGGSKIELGVERQGGEGAEARLETEQPQSVQPSATIYHAKRWAG